MYQTANNTLRSLRDKKTNISSVSKSSGSFGESKRYLARPMIANSSIGNGLTAEKDRTLSNLSRNSARKDKNNQFKESIETSTQIYNFNMG